MAVTVTYKCDISGMETMDQNDVVIFEITRDGQTTITVVDDELVTEALGDDESLLSSIILRDVE